MLANILGVGESSQKAMIKTWKSSKCSRVLMWQWRGGLKSNVDNDSPKMPICTNVAAFQKLEIRNDFFLDHLRLCVCEYVLKCVLKFLDEC